MKIQIINLTNRIELCNILAGLHELGLKWRSGDNLLSSKVTIPHKNITLCIKPWGTTENAVSYGSVEFNKDREGHYITYDANMQGWQSIIDAVAIELEPEEQEHPLVDALDDVIKDAIKGAQTYTEFKIWAIGFCNAIRLVNEDYKNNAKELELYKEITKIGNVYWVEKELD